MNTTRQKCFALTSIISLCQKNLKALTVKTTTRLHCVAVEHLNAVTIFIFKLPSKESVRIDEQQIIMTVKPRAEQFQTNKIDMIGDLKRKTIN